MADNSLGRVLQGAYSGYYVFRAAQFGIEPDAFYLLPNKDATALGQNAVRLDLDSIDGYEEISSRTGPNTNAVIKSTVLGGVGLGLLASSVSSSESAVFAVLLKSGETCTIEIEDTGSVQFFRQSFFTKKGIRGNQPGSGASVARVSGNPDTLLERAFMFLEDGDWSSAEIYCESVLDQDPKCARAYLGKLMSEVHVHTPDQLKGCDKPFDQSDNYRKVLRFGDEMLQQELMSASNAIKSRIEESHKAEIYKNAIRKQVVIKTREDCFAAAQMFESIYGYRDSGNRAAACREKAVAIAEAEKDAVLSKGNAAMEKAKNISDYEAAIKIYSSIRGWRTADECVALCQRKIDEIRLETERKKEEHRVAAEAVKKKAKKIVVIVAPIACAMALLIVLLINVIIPYKKYNAAYNAAVALMDSEQWNEAIAQFQALDGYKDSDEQITACKDGLYNEAVSLMEAGSLDEASAIFHELNHFKESVQNLNKISFLNLKKSLGDIKVGDYITIGQYDSKDIEWLALEKTEGRVLLISKDSICQDCFGLSDSNSWENCLLRQWLDENFRSTAFSENEKRLILKTAIDIEDETQNTVENHRTISDRLFLLSVAEVEKYFSSAESRQCGYSWWLRSPNRKSGWHTTAPAVDSGGQINFYEFDEQFGVRPAMWISLE